MNPKSQPQAQRWLAFLMFAICAWGIADISLDSPDELSPVHLTLEVALLLSSLWGGIWLWRSWRHSEQELQVARTSLLESRNNSDEWRQRAALFIDGFNQAVEEQLAAWALTPTESEVAKLLLRGFSHKTIASATGRSERTVRQHSVAIYKKASLSGRAELSAFFMEGLLPAEPLG